MGKNKFVYDRPGLSFGMCTDILIPVGKVVSLRASRFLHADFP